MVWDPINVTIVVHAGENKGGVKVVFSFLSNRAPLIPILTLSGLLALFPRLPHPSPLPLPLSESLGRRQPWRYAIH